MGGAAGNTAQGGTAGNATADGGVGGFAGNAGEAGAAGVGGADPGNGLPPLGCADAIIWSTDFSSDPSALEVNGDSIADWIIRGGAPFPVSTLAGGVWAAPADQALDTNPPVNFTGHTQLRVRMRDTAKGPPSFPFPGYGGALVWINFDYRGDDFYAVFASISLPRVGERELGIYAMTEGGEVLLGSRVLADLDAFVTIAMDIPAGSGTIAVWLDGVPLPTAAAPRRVVPSQDRFATVIAPQGDVEFDEFWVATCPP